MKHVYTTLILAVAYSLVLQSHTHKVELIVRGKITYGNSYEPLSNAAIVLKDMNHKMINGTFTDAKGNYKCYSGTIGKVIVEIKHRALPKIAYDTLEISEKPESTVDIHLNVDCEFNYPKFRKPKCPLGHRNKIIPIYYGIPDEEQKNKETQGKLKIETNSNLICKPKYFCKEHVSSF